MSRRWKCGMQFKFFINRPIIYSTFKPFDHLEISILVIRPYGFGLDSAKNGMQNSKIPIQLEVEFNLSFHSSDIPFLFH